MRIETIQIKKREKIEEWKLFIFENGKSFRFTKRMLSDFRIWERKYLGHFQYFCLFIKEKIYSSIKTKKTELLYCLLIILRQTLTTFSSQKMIRIQ